ncbi:MAG: glycosyltransferase family 4 protein [Chloroflexi bacterium]|nr:glycosyltransferase family 4 protein [Chloroflexota bacterium]
MRFLHVSHQYPPALGGSEKYIADLSESLVKRGHQVDVFTARSVDFHTWQNVLPAYENINGVNVYRFWSMYRRGSVWRILHFGLRHYMRTRSRFYEPFIFMGGGPISPSMFWQILRQGRQYDLVHLNCLVYAHVAYGYWAARLLNLPTVVTPHLHPEQEATYNIGYQRSVLAGCDHILADTQAEQRFLNNHDLSLPPEKISLVGVGFPLEQYPRGDTITARQRLGLPEDKFILLFFSRKSKYKGLELVVQAFIQLKTAYPQLHLVAAGTETDESKAMWSHYPDLDDVTIMDTVSDEEKIALLQGCDCLALPSVGEAFGIVYLEAWMMEKPVIGAGITAVQDVIDDGLNGLLSEPGNAEDVARCIKQLIDNPTLRQTMGQHGRKKVMNQYIMPRITDRLEDVYKRTLASRGLPYES